LSAAPFRLLPPPPPVVFPPPSLLPESPAPPEAAPFPSDDDPGGTGSGDLDFASVVSGCSTTSTSFPFFGLTVLFSSVSSPFLESASSRLRTEDVAKVRGKPLSDGCTCRVESNDGDDLIDGVGRRRAEDVAKVRGKQVSVDCTCRDESDVGDDFIDGVGRIRAELEYEALDILKDEDCACLLTTRHGKFWP
jgi:hypothetical protein